jgi:surface antigen
VSKLKRALKVFAILLILVLAVYFIFFSRVYPLHVIVHSWTVGDSLDSHNGVAVYNNGPDYPQSHGKHYSADSSYYYGKKWQCVEFVKRYYYDALDHRMPDGFGHAKDFYDPAVKHGSLNKRRNLLQFVNGGNEKPAPGDLLVFGGKYGHVAIITEVTDDEVQVIQQNIFMHPREAFPLLIKDGAYTIGDKRKPVGWLRKRSQ